MECISISGIDLAAPGNDPTTGIFINPLNDVLQRIPSFQEEIREPLTSIYLSVGLLGSGINNIDQQICLDIIFRNSIRINDLINDLPNHLMKS